MRKAFILVSFCIFIALVAGVSGCKTDPDFNAVPVASFGFKIPEGWPQPHYNFENNPLSEDGFKLGRKLFYDTRLSRDNTISCASCHQPFSAFSHLAHDVSHGIDDKLGKRNSPALFNLNWHNNFFWDGGANHIEVQPLGPIQNPVEMDEKLENIIARLEKDVTYKEMFTKAWGSDSITSQRMFKSLAQFMGMLVSSNSRYDKYVRGEAGGEMTGEELTGLNVFREKCAVCHKEPLFSDFSMRNNGLRPTAVNDSGRMRITLNPADKYKFKVPSLRNLKYTYPYMHDGRFSTLDEVLTHYTSNIYQSPTLDPLLKNGIQLTKQEKASLLAFLNTLNDEEFVSDPRFKEVQ